MSIPILPTLSIIFIIISATLVAIGWYKVSRGDIEQHKKIMFFAGIFAFLFFILYSSRTIFLGNTLFGGPDNIKIYYTIFLIFHIILSTSGAVFGGVSLLTGFKEKLAIHRRVGPITSIIWFFTALTGMIVYLLLYIVYSGGETTSMIKAILGS